MAPEQPASRQVPAASHEDWRRIAGASSGRATITEDGIKIEPIYPRATNAAPLALRGARKIIERVTASDGDGAIRQAAEAIAGGAQGIELVFEGSAHPFASRLPIAAAKRLAQAVGALPTRDLTILLDAGDSTPEIAATFAETFSGRASLALAFDPVAAFAVRAQRFDAVRLRESSGTRDVAAALRSAIRIRDALPLAIADGRFWHAAGASEVVELAVVLATLAVFLRAPDPPPLSSLGVALAADTSLFATIAKFRAARLLLARLAEVIGSDASKVAIHAETAWRSLARIEPEVNVLRATVAALGAIAGGAQSLTVLPFDTGGSADRQRLARNTQLIAAHEAHLERVADPGRGSGIIEALTTELAAKAWERFQHLESGGGIIGLVASRAIFKELADRRDERRDRVANGAMPLVGVNVHAAGDVHFGFGMIDPPPRAWLFEKLSSVARPVPPRRGE